MMIVALDTAAATWLSQAVCVRKENGREKRVDDDDALPNRIVFLLW